MAMHPSTITSPEAETRKSSKTSGSPETAKRRLPPYTDPEIAETEALDEMFERHRANVEKGLTKEQLIEAARKGR